ncbi:PTPLA-domain-containing protein [Dichomitus squalens LYAD-421 SS1]|uniref:PTPLA-domain-containing protein n=1 Tax=Dichomitus squalens (strain LYAD-421) TaxID=732165 RepID=UPI0004415CD1|nr:PTPLA-domain-containing protein [Dichomitus squalens LYAD-421 SS1]EJF65490.1 PTPLA-domain-containing protein [Dichomitus squalens LYAD-421 SS1]
MAQIEEYKEPKAQAKKRRGPPPLVKYYLVLYNVLSTVGWAYILFITANVVFNLDGKHSTVPRAPGAATLQRKIENALPEVLVPVIRRASRAFAEVGAQTAFVQSFAALEVLHVLLGWVRSPLVTTLIQVGSRLYLVWGIADLFPKETHTNPLYASMVLSWSLTEVVRYSFYASSLLGAEPAPLVWLRYTLFYVLYPTGASSEAFLMYATLPHPAFGAGWDSLRVYVRGFLFAVWWPGLYVMYTHMIKQRRKVLGGGGPAGPKVKRS